VLLEERPSIDSELPAHPNPEGSTIDPPADVADETLNAIETATTFLSTIFPEHDLLLFRAIETWTEGAKKRSLVDYRNTRYRAAAPQLIKLTILQLLESAAHNHTNLFFGVCPRLGNKGRFDLAWQIRTVRTLWTDIDHVTVDEALERVAKASLPKPSIVVGSGNGAHLYWLLNQPYLIDDVGEPPPVQTDWIAENGRKKPFRYIVDECGEHISIETKRLLPKLSPKAQTVQDILSGIAAKIGGDHTQDLSRLLRLPGTLNRKDERNGKTPIACELVELYSDRRYSLTIFTPLAKASPEAKRREQVAKMPLPTARKSLSPTKEEKFNQAIAQCSLATKGNRSHADFALCCQAIRLGVPMERLRAEVAGTGKFAEGGERYFDRTWNNAADEVREQSFEKLEKKQRGIERRNAHAASQSAATEKSQVPTIIVDVDEARVADEAIAALGSQSNLYQRSGALVRIVEDPPPPPCLNRPDGGLVIAPLPEARLRELLTICTMLVRDAGQAGEVPCHPPQWLIEAIDVRAHWPGIPRLEGIVESPVLLADGSILQTAGYDSRSGLYFAPRCEFPHVPERPTQADAQKACKCLLEIIGDFPLKKEEHRSAWMAAALTPAARHAIDGPCPLVAIDANVRGSGKSLLADSIGVFYTGRRLSRTSAPKDDEEARKKITSIALAAETLVLIDNVGITLGCPALDAALTSTTWSDRILGKSQMTGAIPLTTIWFATGNNLVFGADTARRVLHIRLESDEESPEERTGFQHPDLLGWVRQERGRLAVAALTVLRAYIVAGKPDMRLKEWGSFEAWSRLIRHALVWCGYEDPGKTRQEVAETSDRETSLLRLLIGAWEQADPKRNGLTVSEAINLSATAKGYELLRDAIHELTPVGKPLSPKSIGMKLKHLRDRVCGGKRFTRDKSRAGGVWKIAEVGSSGTGLASSPCATRATGGTKTKPSTRKKKSSPCNGAHIAAGDSSSAGSASSAVGSCDEPAATAGRTQVPAPLSVSAGSIASAGYSANPSCGALHIQSDRWTHRDGKAYCPVCNDFMGYVPVRS
jgi:hypothetical protein